MIHECQNCGKRSRKLGPILMQDWLSRQDPADTIGLPIGECPKCCAPIYHPNTLAKISAAKEMLRALRAIKKMTDGSQPKDYPGALMVADYAITRAERAGMKAK